MPCYSPLHGYYNRHTNDSGKRGITFNRSSGYTDLAVTVPCGRCIGCRIDRSRMWAIRCVHESKNHNENCFVTLTYDDKHLPKDYGLVKSDLQKFMRALRDKGFEFRYFAAGEYGDQTLRPHYHAILFGLSFAFDRKKHSVNKRGDVLYTSKTLSDTWGKGHVLVSSFSYATAAYTARYVMKKQNGKDAMQHENYSRLEASTGEVYQVQPEFCLMSRRPGIGASWYDKYKKDAFPSDFLVHEGKMHSVPRYYLDKLSKEDPSMYEDIRFKRKQKRLETAENNTADRLFVRETVKKAAISQLSRSL